MNFDIGDAPIFTVEFRDRRKVLTDPSTVVCRYRAPNGTQVDLDCVPVDVGIWEAEVPPITQSGRHHIKFFGMGTLVAAAEVTFRVGISAFN